MINSAVAVPSQIIISFYKEIAELFSMNVMTVYRYIKAKKLKAIKLTPRVFRIDEKDLNQFLKKHKTKSFLGLYLQYYFNSGGGRGLMARLGHSFKSHLGRGRHGLQFSFGGFKFFKIKAY